VQNARVRNHRLRVERPSPSSNLVGRPTSARTRIRRQDQPIAQLCALWSASLAGAISNRGKPYSPESIRGYTTHLKVFADWCGERPISELDADLFEEFIRHLWAKGQTANTVQSRDKAARLFFAWCLKRGLIDEDPGAELRRTSVQDTEIVTFTDADVARLLDVCDRGTWGGTRTP
jgi:integrase/recombinase XerD